MKDFQFTLESIESLIDIAKNKDIEELKISNKDFKITIKVKSNTNTNNNTQSKTKQNKQNDSYEKNYDNQDDENISKKPTEDKKEEKPAEPTTEGNVISSPIVGTFYESPAPKKPPFVKVGDSVKKGDTLFIIESMKLLNEIKSEFDGVVEKILVKSGDSVDYAQPIMIIK